MPACQLKSMTHKEDLFFLNVGRISVPAFYLVQPGEINFFPFTILTFKRTAGAAGRNINIITEIGYLFFETYFKFIPIHIELIVLTKLIQNFTDTPHALVGKSLIHIQDSNTD